ncbi:MAG: translation initiation factor IF-2 N-terminal domain-containing protein [Limisphaerales bacterium]
MPIRIYDIAKKLGVETKQVLAKAKELGIAAAKVPSSVLDTAIAERLEQALRAVHPPVLAPRLTAIGLGNFKAFHQTQTVPLRPITLIFGANSSGKSSLLHGLLLARHALDKGELDVFKTEIGGDSVDLGGFRQFVHRRDASQRVEWRMEFDAARIAGRLCELLPLARIFGVTLSIGVELNDRGEPVSDARPSVMSYALDADAQNFLRMSLRPEGHLQLDWVDPEALGVVTQAIVEAVTTMQKMADENEGQMVRKAMSEFVSSIRFGGGKLLPEPLKPDTNTNRISAASLFPVSRGRRAEDLSAVVELVFPRIIGELVSGANTLVAAELARLKYLGPLRSFPSRHLAFSEHGDQNWYAGGAYAWDVVRMNAKVREAVNLWLSAKDRLQTPYRLEVQRLLGIDYFRGAMEKWMFGDPAELLAEMRGEQAKRKEAAEDDDAKSSEDAEFVFDDDPEMQARRVLKQVVKEQEYYGFNELVLHDVRTGTKVTHRDVGIGVSQVLPVLVHAYADEGKIVAIEQPEIHLHPALQAELGDVFIESALGERRNTFLLETHSEHLILRILRRVRETTEGKLPAGSVPVRPEDVSVLFVEPTNQGSVVQQLPVTPDGDFGAPWPGGFFAERFQDLP